MVTGREAGMDVDYAGRVSKEAFVVSTSTPFAVVLVSLFFRLLIRVGQQREFKLDDAFIVLGVALIAVAMGAFYYYGAEMYTMEALILGESHVVLTSTVIHEAFNFRRWVAVSLTLLWSAISCVKLSFLILFRRLIDRMPAMNRYWWFVFSFTIFVWAFGIAAYFGPCPDFYSLTTLITCNSGSQLELTKRLSIAQWTLDVIGDLMIVAIPIRLIWQVKVSWTHKIALFLSLCLSIVLVAVTITRASGLIFRDVVDIVWEVYWQYISAEVGLILSSAAAFRAFFVTRQSPGHVRARRRGEAHIPSGSAWYRILKSISAATSGVLFDHQTDQETPPPPPSKGNGHTVALSRLDTAYNYPGLDAPSNQPRTLVRPSHSLADQSRHQFQSNRRFGIVMDRAIEIRYD